MINFSFRIKFWFDQGQHFFWLVIITSKQSIGILSLVIEYVDAGPSNIPCFLAVRSNGDHCIGIMNNKKPKRIYELARWRRTNYGCIRLILIRIVISVLCWNLFLLKLKIEFLTVNNYFSINLRILYCKNLICYYFDVIILLKINLSVVNLQHHEI